MSGNISRFASYNFRAGYEKIFSKTDLLTSFIQYKMIKGNIRRFSPLPGKTRSRQIKVKHIFSYSRSGMSRFVWPRKWTSNRSKCFRVFGCVILRKIIWNSQIDEEEMKQLIYPPADTIPWRKQRHNSTLNNILFQLIFFKTCVSWLLMFTLWADVYYESILISDGRLPITE